MRKSSGVGAVLVALGSTAPAPDARAQSAEVGVKGGVHSATIAWSPTPLGASLGTVERRTASTFGAWAAFPASSRVRLHVEALHTGKGFREVEGDGDVASLDVDYVEVPLLVGVALREPGGRWTPELYAGPWFAWERDCRASLANEELSISFACDDVPEEPVLRRTTDYGVAAGAQLAVQVVPGVGALLDVRYSAGLRNVDAAPSVDNADVHHRGFTVAAGFALALHR